MLRGKYLIIISALVITAGIAAASLWLKPGSQTASFYDCAATGNPILDTFPRLCQTPDGQNFVEPIQVPNEFKIEDLKTGSGAEALPGDTVAAHYSGQLENGLKFDSSYDRGQPFVFALGAGQVIKGWDLGLIGMKPGGVRKLIIPPSLGYGNKSIGKIPPSSTLIFEVELIDIKDK